jgi:hypothetical protein
MTSSDQLVVSMLTGIPSKSFRNYMNPMKKIIEWHIKRAREHTKNVEPGLEACKPKIHLISLDM